MACVFSVVGLIQFQSHRQNFKSWNKLISADGVVVPFHDLDHLADGGH